ncbi:MAG: AI-2E family transporter [Gammaproteobacteria bacterium]|nr:AI-2E family transporter [Gammaproteobacteria bacterium]
MNNQWTASSSYFKTTRVFLSIVAIFFVSILLLSSILVPIIISFSLYSLLNPFTAWLIRKNINRALAIILSLLLMILVSSLALLYAIPKVFGQLLQLQERLPSMLTIIEKYAAIANHEITALTGFELNFPEIFMGVLAQSSSVSNTILVYISNQITSVIIASILIPFITYFLLKDYRNFRNSMMNWLPNSSFELGWLIYHRVATQLQDYTRGVMIQSFIMASVASFGFYIIGLEIPVLMGIITGLLNLIPYIGPIISLIFAFLTALAMTPFDPSLLYLVVIVIFSAQLIDNIIVIPYVIANAVNLHPVMVILGVIIFGNVFGMVGIILAIPAIAASKILFINLYSNISNSSKHQTLNKT